MLLWKLFLFCLFVLLCFFLSVCLFHSEFGTGRDRLVKVIEKVKLAHLADSLGK